MTFSCGVDEVKLEFKMLPECGGPGFFMLADEAIRILNDARKRRSRILVAGSMRNQDVMMPGRGGPKFFILEVCGDQDVMMPVCGGGWILSALRWAVSRFLMPPMHDLQIPNAAKMSPRS